MKAYLKRMIEAIFDFAYPEDNQNWPRLSLAPSPWIQCAGKAESFHGRQGATGFEPVTSRSAVECSPTELCPPVKGLSWTNKSGEQTYGQRTQDGLIDLFTLALLVEAPNHPRMCRYRLKSAPITALAGNRTRASRVAGENSTTEPPVPVWELKEASHPSGPPHSEAKRWQISSHFVSAMLSWKPNREQVCYTTEYPPGPWTMLFIHSRWVATEV